MTTRIVFFSSCVFGLISAILVLFFVDGSPVIRIPVSAVSVLLPFIFLFTSSSGNSLRDDLALTAGFVRKGELDRDLHDELSKVPDENLLYLYCEFSAAVSELRSTLDDVSLYASSISETRRDSSRYSSVMLSASTSVSKSAVLADFPGIKIVSHQTGVIDFDERSRDIERHMDRTSDFDLIAGLNAGFTFSLLKLKNRRNLDGKIVIGFDNIPVNYDALRTGVLDAVVAQRQEIFGSTAIKYIHALETGKKVEEINYLATYELNKRNAKVLTG
jgi:hypothetical protein